MVRSAARWAGVLAAGLYLLQNAASQQVGGSASQQSQATATNWPVTLQSSFADGAAHPYCAVLDAAAFAASAPGLRGLRLLQNGAEIPFLTTISAPVESQTDAVRVLNLREEDGALRFDLAMPQRAYTAIQFNLARKNFAATAAISADDTETGTHARRVGEYVLFDLSSDRLARQTAVALPEMRDRYLHVTLHLQADVLHAKDLLGVDVPPPREAQSVYSTVAATHQFVNTVRETIAEFDVPAHVPVQRIHFEWNAKAANFLRRVRVEAWPSADPNDVETISGAISSTHRVQSDIALDDAQHDVAMTLGANLQGPAHMRIIVERGGDGPLPLTHVELQMRQHKICFDAKSGVPVVLRAGDDEAAAGASVAALANEAWERAGEAVIGDGAEVSAAPFVPVTHCYGGQWKPFYYGGALVLLGGVIFWGWWLWRRKR